MWCEYFDENFRVQIEERQGLKFVHLDVKNWKKSVFWDMMDVLEDMLYRYGTLYADRVDDKQEKFMQMFGFLKTKGHCELPDGTRMEIFVCQSH